MRNVETLAERFWPKVDRRSPDECWVWTARRCTRGGYGEINVDGRAAKAHRVSLQLAGVHVPKGAAVIHACDRPECVNPAHLRVGTLAENNRDASAKGRSSPGTCNVITHEQAMWAHRASADGATNDEIAQTLNLTQGYVSRMLSGRERRSAYLQFQAESLKGRAYVSLHEVADAEAAR